MTEQAIEIPKSDQRLRRFLYQLLQSKLTGDELADVIQCSQGDECWNIGRHHGVDEAMARLGGWQVEIQEVAFRDRMANLMAELESSKLEAKGYREQLRKLERVAVDYEGAVQRVEQLAASLKSLDGVKQLTESTNSK